MYAQEKFSPNGFGLLYPKDSNMTEETANSNDTTSDSDMTEETASSNGTTSDSDWTEEANQEDELEEQDELELIAVFYSGV